MARVVSAGSRYALKPLAEIRPDALWLPWGVEGKALDAPVQRPAAPPHVASFNRVKDHATLLRAIRIVLDRGLAVGLNCVGEDTLGGAVQRLANDLGLQTAARFHGFHPLPEVVPFYRQPHLYLQSSLHESMGAAVLEAAAGGVPTVGTAVGLVAEMAPQAAVAVPLRTPDALAHGIINLLKHARDRESIGHAARGFALAYDADWTAAQFNDLYTRRTAYQTSSPQPA